MKTWFFGFILFWSTFCSAQSCWELAERETGINRYLLYAVSKVESSHRPLAMAVAKKGIRLSRQPTSYHEALAWANWFDKQGYIFAVGMTQINWPVHRARLQAKGVTLEKLLADRCLQIREGAFILADSFQIEGANWNGVGGYYTGPKNRKLPFERYTYAKKVHYWYVRYIKNPPPLD